MVRGWQGDDSSRARGAPSPPVMAVASATAPVNIARAPEKAATATLCGPTRSGRLARGRPRPSGGTQAQRTAEENVCEG
mgnify:CR=1 FL=1